MLSQGVPMLLGGDEIGRTQRGNNNGYCQDNEMSWYDWEHADERAAAVHAPADPAAAPRIPCSAAAAGSRAADRTDRASATSAGSRPAGTEMSDEDWQAGFAKSLGVFLNGDAIPTPNERGERVVDDSFYVMFNAHHEPVDFTLPPKEWGARWTLRCSIRSKVPTRCQRSGSGASSSAGDVVPCRRGRSSCCGGCAIPAGRSSPRST